MTTAAANHLLHSTRPGQAAKLVGDKRVDEGNQPMPLNALHHITVQTNDLEATRDFYRDVLGLEVGFRHMALSLARASETRRRTDEKHPPMRWIRGRYGTVKTQKSAMRAVPGAGIAGGVWTHTKGCGCRPNRADQAIAIPENAAISATKYWARNTLAIAVPAAWQNASA